MNKNGITGINSALAGLETRGKELCPDSFYTASQREFWKLDSPIMVPEIPVKSLDFGLASEFAPA